MATAVVSSSSPAHSFEHVRSPSINFVPTPKPTSSEEEGEEEDSRSYSPVSSSACSTTSSSSISSSPPYRAPAMSQSPTPSPPSSDLSTPTSNNSSGVVPAYPYNVSMPPYIPGSAVSLTGFFGTHGPLPDDHDVQTRLPSICVDYLSHDWAEDDVWTSWKAMTRHKNEIANGLRLENASWRTWAKQRNKLKTISPETLNWLKDSDVTWLYGPLHTAADPVPPPKAATMEDRLNIDAPRPALLPPTKRSNSTEDMAKRMSKKPVSKKPILKHRSLSEILSMPGSSSPVLEATDDGEVSPGEDGKLLYVKSDPNMARKRKVSPPAGTTRGLSPERHQKALQFETDASSDDSSSTGNVYTPTGSEERAEKRKHISFNHRVEQCIAVDSEEDERRYNFSGSDEGDDEDEVLSFRSSPRTPHFLSSKPPAMTNHDPAQKEPHTIAKLAPTTLKSSEVLPAPSPAVVYSPGGSGYETTALGASYARPPSHVGVGDDTSSTSSTAAAAARVPAVQAKPVQQPQPQPGPSTSRGPAGGVASAAEAGSDATDGVGNNKQRGFVYEYTNQPTSSWDEEDEYSMGFDYFRGPDLGVGDEYDMAHPASSHLVGGPNGYSSPSSSTVSSPSSHPGQNGRGGGRSSSSSNSSSTASRKSGGGSGKGYSPSSSGTASPTNTKDSVQPHKGILKHRGPSSRDSSDSLGAQGGRNGGGVTDNTNVSAHSSTTTTPTNQSPAVSPSASGSYSYFTGQGQAGAGNDPQLNTRGRSTSRGSSSSSYERSASADRRSNPSLSPSAIYPPSYPSSVQAIADGADTAMYGTQPISIPRGRGSWASGPSSVGADGQNEMGSQSDAGEVSENETVRAESGSGREGEGSQSGVHGGNSADISPTGRPPPVNKLHQNHHDDDDDVHLFDSPAIPSSPNADGGGSRSSSFTSLHQLRWSDEPASSSQGRRTSRAHHLGPNSANRGPGGASVDMARRSSTDSGQSGNTDDFGFGYGYDEDDGGIVSRAVEIAGTARDLFGALWNVGTNSIWRRSRSESDA